MNVSPADLLHLNHAVAAAFAMVSILPNGKAKEDARLHAEALRRCANALKQQDRRYRSA